MARASDCVEVDRSLDIAEVERVCTALTSAVSRAAVDARRRVVLDLTDCDFVDVVGHRMLSDVARAADRSGVALDVVGARASVIRVITILDAVLAEDVRARVVTDAGAASPSTPRVAPAAS